MYSIITINTWKCDGDYHSRINALINQLKELNPDILLLQEAFQSSENELDTTKRIAQEFGMEHLSSLSRPKKRFLTNKYIYSYSNVSILTRHQIINRYNFSLPTNEEDGGRDAVMAEIAINNQKILVCSLHLSHLKNGESLRLNQLLHLLSQEPLKKNYGSILIGGDFNMEISHQFLELLKDSGFLLYDTFNPSNIQEAFTLDNGTKKVKIDHILELKKPNAVLKVNHSQIVFQSPCKEFGVKISDHNGVLLNFSFDNE